MKRLAALLITIFLFAIGTAVYMQYFAKQAPVDADEFDLIPEELVASSAKSASLKTPPAISDLQNNSASVRATHKMVKNPNGERFKFLAPDVKKSH